MRSQQRFWRKKEKKSHTHTHPGVCSRGVVKHVAVYDDDNNKKGSSRRNRAEEEVE